MQPVLRMQPAPPADRPPPVDRPLVQADGEIDLQLPMGTWLGFHDGDAPLMAKLAVHDPELNLYIFVNREGIKMRQLNQQELIALRAAGWSNLRIARPAAVLALLIVIAAMATQQWLIPILEQQIADLRANTLLDTDVDKGDAQFWTRSENQLVRIGGVQFGLMPTDVEIYQLDDQGHLAQLLQANRADILSADSWRLYDVRSTRITEQGTEVREISEMLWKSVLSPDQMATIITTAAALSPTDLLRYIEHLEVNELDSHRYRLVLWQQLSLPLGIFGMALLGVPFVVGSTRSMAAGTRISIGIAIGLMFYLAERTIGQLALLYDLPPLPMAMGPDILVAAIAVIALSRAR